eukprot:1351394-Prymnesium_polylepis.1
MVAPRHLLVVCLALLAPGEAKKKRRRSSSSREVSSHTDATVTMAVGTTGEQAELSLKLPNRAVAISTTGELMKHVSHAWDVVVAPHQAGLSDAKAAANEAVIPLGPEEAWHHFEASKRGVVDSARLLVAFSIVPSLQAGGTPLHAAAARGDVDAIAALLDDENVHLD